MLAYTLLELGEDDVVDAGVLLLVVLAILEDVVKGVELDVLDTVSVYVMVYVAVSRYVEFWRT